MRGGLFTMIDRFVDLHMHTNYSDGIFVEPEQLLFQAAQNSLDVIAISDHDHIGAYDEAKPLAEKYGVTLIPAAEITTDDYHLLALNFDPENPDMRDFLAYSRRLQENNVHRKIEHLNSVGISITFSEVKDRFPESRLGTMNVYTVLMSDVQYKLKIRGPEGYFKTYRMITSCEDKTLDSNVTVEEAIHVVHKAGGLIGLAHPPKDVNSVEELDYLVKAGIDFLEIQPSLRNRFPDHPIDYDFVERYAHDKGLPVSFGSDYHGPTMERFMLKSGQGNLLTGELEEMLNRGFVKIN